MSRRNVSEFLSFTKSYNLLVSQTITVEMRGTRQQTFCRLHL